MLNIFELMNLSQKLGAALERKPELAKTLADALAEVMKEAGLTEEETAKIQRMVDGVTKRVK